MTYDTPGAFPESPRGRSRSVKSVADTKLGGASGKLASLSTDAFQHPGGECGRAAGLLNDRVMQKKDLIIGIWNSAAQNDETWDNG